MRSPRRLLAIWRLARESGLLLFDSGAGDALRSLPGWASLGFTADCASGVLEAVRALELLEREHGRTTHQVSIVATLPEAGSDIATTRDAVTDLVRSAENGLVVLGFGLTDNVLRAEMIGAARRGVEVIVVGERSRDDLLALARSWPALVPAATFLQLVEPQPGTSSLMHAKVIVADRRRALVGSANFSTGGLSTNMELGLIVEGPAAERVCIIVERLRSTRWLEPLTL